MDGRIFLASGFFALAGIAGALVIASLPETDGGAAGRPAALAMAQAGHEAAPRGVLHPRTASAALVQADAAPAPAPVPAPVPAPQDQGFTIKRILPIDGPIRYGEWHWDDAGVPAGPIVVTVDLEARVLSVFRGGYEIGATAVLLGTEDKPTPLGVFPITEKDRDHVSNIYTGAPMPYMQRLTNDGITLHGSQVALGYASHGCVGMPEAFARKLFATTSIGDKVYITRGKQVGMGDSLAG